MIVISGGDVYTPNGWQRTDVNIDGDRVVSLGPSDREPDQIIDATGCLVGPGFVDLHTHLREPGQTWKEDLETGTLSGAAGGYTALVAMPNTDPPTDSPKLVREMQRRAEERGHTDVFVAGAVTKGRQGMAPADLRGMYDERVRIFSDDGDCVSDREVLTATFERLSVLDGAVLAQHAEDASRTRDGHMHEGTVSRQLEIAGLPASAESDIVARDIELVANHDIHYHCQHVSARETVEVIRRAKKRGLKVTAEVTPHHLVLDESHLVDLDTNLKMYPPLRGEGDRIALVNALQDGTIDVVATDHAPHTQDEKSVPFTAAPRGVIGLETAASVVWSVLDDRDRFFAVMSETPADIGGLEDHGQPVEPGALANLVVFDPGTETTYERFKSRSQNSPFLGATLPGSVVATIRRGEPIHQRGEPTR